MIVYTATSVDEETDHGEALCGATVDITCWLHHRRERSCPEPTHPIFCTRAADHPSDLHIATTSDQVIAAAWRADQ